MHLSDGSMAVIALNGMRLPLEAAIDTFDFKRFDYDRDGHVLPREADRNFQAQAILRDGTVIQSRASELPWHDLIAFRAEEGCAVRCGCCEDLVGTEELWEVADYAAPCCESCASYGDWH